MSKNKSINDLVVEKLSRMPLLQEPLRLGIGNYSAIARMIKPSIEKDAGKIVADSALMVAVKRFAQSLPKAGLTEQLREILADCSLEVITDLGSITLPRGAWLSPVDLSEVLYTVQGKKSLTLVMNRNALERTLKKIKGTARKDLTALSIQAPVESIDVPGFYYTLFETLASNNINVIDVVSTPYELIILVDKKDAIPGFGALNGLLEGCRG